ncbi:amyloid-beta precursor-like protein isoform X1 [Crassostrea angulata]|uniref:amyloid-beta precursor-like protein isoform X1 n=1 Tax=Magallana angulata TaxID=2784310 RepID=UPI0022B1CD3F|nr:amyloid-beta precursor-like protein isoform X1 [Crassostrea angulata]
MGQLTLPSVLACICVLVQVSVGYIESLAANTDFQRHDYKFVPMVAFMCNKPTMHTTPEGWVADSKQDCLHDEKQILQYCQKLYPNMTITNIVEDHKLTIQDWPDSHGHKHGHTVQPFRCVVGPFESDALLVPQHCHFYHEHNQCDTYKKWGDWATADCQAKDMRIDSFSMLLDCDIDRFAGVEYVCCPKEKKVIDSSVTLKPVKEETEHMKLDDTYNAYMAYLKGDEKYLKHFGNEHNKFLAALKAMNMQHHERITKMMKEWQTARKHVNNLKKTNPKAADKLNKNILERFQKLYNGYQQSDSAEKKQLVALHLQHRQGELNGMKRKELEAYMAELQKSPVRSVAVLKHLEHYIRVEEKDRLHSLNHFTHVKKTNPEEAKLIQSQVIEHMKVIDERIKQSLDMLHHFPKVESKLKTQIDKFMKQYSGLAESAKNIVMRPITVQTKKESNKATWTEKVMIDDENDDGDLADHLQEVKKTPIVEDDGLMPRIELNHQEENKVFISHRENDQASFNQGSYSSAHVATSTGSVFGIAIGSVAVFVIIIVAIVMLRKRSHRHPVTHGFAEMDPAASPEERHVANMQMNGYENPTYKYFELNTNAKK